MYQLEEISFMYLLVLLPILFLIFIINKNWQRTIKKKYFDSNTIEYLSPEISNKKPFLKFLIKSIAIILLVFALVNPKIGTELKTVKREGVDLDWPMQRLIK